MIKRFLIYSLISLALILTTIGCEPNVGIVEEEVEAEVYVPVEVEVVGQRTIANEITLSGRVFADKDIMVLPKIPGKVTSVRVSIGDRVKKGDTLFVMDSEDVQKQVDQAKEGLDRAKEAYAMAEKQVAEAKANLENLQKLHGQGVVSSEQLQQAQMGASDRNLDPIRAQVTQAQMAYDQAKGALDNFTIKAPISGVVSTINVQAGGMAANTQPAMTIIDTERVFVQINVTEGLLSQLNKDKEARIRIRSFSEEIMVGSIDSISPSPDMRTQLYPVKIYIDNVEDKIRPGMFAEVRVDTNIREDVLAIRSQSVLQRGERTVVYIADGDKVIEREVNIGIDTGEYVEILEGLNVGDRVLVKGQDYVEDGSTIKVVRGDQ